LFTPFQVISLKLSLAQQRNGDFHLR
jgi:hypothetical protein